MPERLLGFIFRRRLLLIAALCWRRRAAQGCLPPEGSGGVGRGENLAAPRKPHFFWVFLRRGAPPSRFEMRIIPPQSCRAFVTPASAASLRLCPTEGEARGGQQRSCSTLIWGYLGGGRRSPLLWGDGGTCHRLVHSQLRGCFPGLMILCPVTRAARGVALSFLD